MNALFSQRCVIRARAILDDVERGGYHSLPAINWALRVLGDL